MNHTILKDFWAGLLVHTVGLLSGSKAFHLLLVVKPCGEADFGPNGTWLAWNAVLSGALGIEAF